MLIAFFSFRLSATIHRQEYYGSSGAAVFTVETYSVHKRRAAGNQPTIWLKINHVYTVAMLSSRLLGYWQYLQEESQLGWFPNVKICDLTLSTRILTRWRWTLRGKIIAKDNQRGRRDIQEAKFFAGMTTFSPNTWPFLHFKTKSRLGTYKLTGVGVAGRKEGNTSCDPGKVKHQKNYKFKPYTWLSQEKQRGHEAT